VAQADHRGVHSWRLVGFGHVPNRGEVFEQLFLGDLTPSAFELQPAPLNHAHTRPLGLPLTVEKSVRTKSSRRPCSTGENLCSRARSKPPRGIAMAAMTPTALNRWAGLAHDELCRAFDVGRFADPEAGTLGPDHAS
jgi:hypothetical protein